ncbi:hypothetical protein EV128_107213 [Rhizobium azibense]|nr:hypothetical protein EV128_107213 [Rhizobium azibense]
MAQIPAGDPGVARRVLYVGRRIASQWDGGVSRHEQDSQEREERAKGVGPWAIWSLMPFAMVGKATTVRLRSAVLAIK